MNLKSYLMAATLVMVLVGWMASGYLVDAGHSAETAEQSGGEPAPAMTVQVREQGAEEIERYLESQGETHPERQVLVRAETTGRVAEVLAEKGARVNAGEPIVELAMKDRKARLEQAEALVAQRRADYQAIKRLNDGGFQSESQQREAYTALQAAEAELEAIREDIANTVVRAPFDGVLADRRVETGDFLSPGDPVASVVDIDPLKVEVDIAQQDVGALSVGAPAQVALATGESLSGRVSFIAPAAEPGTRTFDVEIAVANPDGIPAGVSATARLPLSRLQAHFLSPALLSLDSEGRLGAKSVADDGRVQFHPVNIVRTERNGVWVTGLPDRLRLITVGQGFVRAGERVRAVPQDEAQISLDNPEAPGAAAEQVDG